MFRASIWSDVDLASLFNNSPNPYVILDSGLAIVGMNEAYLRVTAQTREALVGRNLFDAFPSDPASPQGRQLRASFERVLSTGRVDHLSQIAYPIAGADGALEERYWSATHTPLLDSTGKVAFVLQHTVDVTELHRLKTGDDRGAIGLETDVLRRADAVQNANLLLDDERRYLRGLFDQAPSLVVVLRGPDHIVEITNAAYQELTGQRDILGKPVRAALPAAEGQGFFELLDWVYGEGRTHVSKSVRVSARRDDGRPAEDRFIDFHYQPLRDADGQVTGIFVQGHDVTEQKRAEAAAAESDSRFRSLAQSMPNHAWTARPDGNLDWFNEQVYAYCGKAQGALDGAGWASIVHPDDLAATARAWAAALAQGELYQTEFRLRRADGSYRWHLGRAVPFRDAQGAIVRWIGTNTDIEDQKAAAVVLADMNAALEAGMAARTEELLRAQEALRQSQKMEAIGNLAGGIAHDFNNMLQVIGGNLQLLARALPRDDQALRRLRDAEAGVARGANLATQLLAFGRRQPLEPRVVNVGRLVRDMDQILRRTLGEGVEIETLVDDDLWHTLIDPGNVESALLNLALNARDAMAGQGRLIIEAGNAVLDPVYAARNDEVVPGHYVLLAVSDTGCGMAPDLVDKVFEPFFTTKAEGKGSGLGLSMVYGFVKQSGGHAKIYSEPGRGTSIKLYLPRSHQPEEPQMQVDKQAPTGGSETVLVVEDDAAVRETTVALLSDLGYRVLQAGDAASALAIVEEGAAVDLLFSDVVMPGPLRSTDLAREAKLRLPRLAVLFTSGYTENAIVHGGRLDPGVNLLGKPYSGEALARKLRHVLANEAQRQAPAPAVAEAPPPPTKTVLLCEDDALIRTVTVLQLEDLGYSALEAGSAAQALELLRQHSIKVLVTDIGLPDMPGTELARRAMEIRPDLSVIFASGQADTGRVELPRAIFLPKPYDKAGLARALARACAQEAGDQD